VIIDTRGGDNYLYTAKINSSNYNYIMEKYKDNFTKISKMNIIVSSKQQEKFYDLSINADKDGYVYVTNEYLKTITKFSPLKDGEDITVDLKDYKVTY
jgi:hypothetical protein